MREQERRLTRQDVRHVRPPTAVRPPASHTGSALPPITALQRTAGNSAVVQMLAQQQEDALAPAPTDVQRSTVHSMLRSPGRPLDNTVRTEMEARLGADFSTVRLHDGAAAYRYAAEIGARAYTSGEHIVIGRQDRDKHTLAHELTHVIQQRWVPCRARRTRRDPASAIRRTVSSGQPKRTRPGRCSERHPRRNASCPTRTPPGRPATGLSPCNGSSR